jgi:LmbE family N-acetylglucosaminyl deacetylase
VKAINFLWGSQSWLQPAFSRLFGLRRCSATLVVAALAVASGASAQRNFAGADATKLALERLTVTGSALMIAAHPDDENTALLAWLARGRKVRTGYLSLTRGEGGQNLIGPDQGHTLGLIRTQELLAARRIDGAQQFFTRAVDFGFTKSADETLEKWGREQILGDIVYVIRKFRPDVIVLRFSGTPRDGHGQHQASAILGREAFTAAADPKRFPEQLVELKPWQAKRLLWNVFAFNRQQEIESAKLADKIEVDLGSYDGLIGYSYSEIAGQSRSMHRSQAMGSSERRGSVKNALVHVAGEPAKLDLFEGVRMSWEEPLAGILAQANLTFDPRQPRRTVEALLKARPLIGDERKRHDLDEAIAMCTGLWADASVDRPTATANTKLPVTIQVVNRSSIPITFADIQLAGDSVKVEEHLEYNRLVTRKHEWTTPAGRPRGHVTDPEPPPYAAARFRFRIGDETIELLRPVENRYVDSLRGELTRPFYVVPPVSVKFAQSAVIFPSSAPKHVDIQVQSWADAAAGDIKLDLPPDWGVKPASIPFSLSRTGEGAVIQFEITPPAGKATAEADLGSAVGVSRISYSHIPTQLEFVPPRALMQRVDVKTLARTVGYVMGAGDAVPEALRQLGCEVTLLSSDDLQSGDLRRFDAIVTGVRAFNTRSDLRANMGRLLNYVNEGGTMVVQYNVLEGGPFGNDSAALGSLGPYPIRLGRFRVSVEEAPVEVLKSGHPILSKPNRITSEDFAGWVQERGLYFASEWDPNYETVIASADPGEKTSAGGMLYARYGKGAYVFTTYSWFRQLPAGVPGAYKIFANLLSAGKAQ